MRNTKKSDVSSSLSGRLSQASDKKDVNDEEVTKKIDELRKKARQEMMDYEALDGVSLTHYLRIRQASRLLSTDENMNEEGEHAALAIQKVKEEEMQKMARTVLKKWQNFTQGEVEPREVRPKRRKSVRFKDEVEAKENSTLESIATEKHYPKDVQIVFPAIIQPRPNTRQKRKKTKEHFMGTLLPPIPQNDEQNKDTSSQITKNEFTEVLIQDRLPKLKLKPVSLTTKTPPPSEEDEIDSDVNPSKEFVIHEIPDNITLDSSQELLSQTNRNSNSSLGRQPTPFPGDKAPEQPNALVRETSLFWKLKKKFNESPKTKSGRRKMKEDKKSKFLLKRIESYEVFDDKDLHNNSHQKSD